MKWLNLQSILFFFFNEKGLWVWMTMTVAEKEVKWGILGDGFRIRDWQCRREAQQCSSHHWFLVGSQSLGYTAVWVGTVESSVSRDGTCWVPTGKVRPPVNQITYSWLNGFVQGQRKKKIPKWRIKLWLCQKKRPKVRELWVIGRKEFKSLQESEDVS